MSRFITFEGPDGAGKSTQIALLAEYLTRQGYAVHCTREPGGTPIGDQIRRVLHDVANTQMSPVAEILLYSASRAQLTAQVIKPLLAAGTIVLCDRYADSTFAYQGYGRGLDMETLQAITRFATGGLKPDLTIFLDLPVEVGLSRKKEASEAGEGEFNRMDRLTVDFHRRVRAGYLSMSRAEPQRWVVLDACRPVEAIQADIRRALHTLGLGEAKP